MKFHSAYCPLKNISYRDRVSFTDQSVSYRMTFNKVLHRLSALWSLQSTDCPIQSVVYEVAFIDVDSADWFIHIYPSRQSFTYSVLPIEWPLYRVFPIYSLTECPLECVSLRVFLTESPLHRTLKKVPCRVSLKESSLQNLPYRVYFTKCTLQSVPNRVSFT